MFLGASQNFWVVTTRSLFCVLCVLTSCRKYLFAPWASGEAQRCGAVTRGKRGLAASPTIWDAQDAQHPVGNVPPCHSLPRVHSLYTVTLLNLIEDVSNAG